MVNVAGFIETEIGELLNKSRIWREAESRPPILPTASPEFGDYTCTANALAKALRQPPNVIAKSIMSDIQAFLPSGPLGSAACVGNYINFTVEPARLAERLLPEIHQAGAQYGSADLGHGGTVVIDLSSPNIAKPFHVGHLRSTVVGSCLYRLLNKMGYRSIGVNHLGDWGTQFGKLIVAYKKYGTEISFDSEPIYALLDLYIRFHQEAKTDPSLEDQAREEFRKLEAGEPEPVAIWKRFYEYSLAEYRRIYRLLNSTIDHYTGESFYNDKMDAALELLERKGLTQVSREALIVDLEQYGLGAALLKKSDEATLYLTRDLAALLYRRQTFRFSKALYVVGSAQSLHFKQLFKLIELLGYDWYDQCRHVEFGWIKFGAEMMSTREGNVVFLDDVIKRATELAEQIIREKNPELENVAETAQAIGVGAIIYSDLAVRRNHDISFRWEDALNFDGNTGPYLQYSHARLCSLERKYEQAVTATVDFSLLTEPEVKRLLLGLYRFPEKLNQAVEEYEPAIICGYLFDLAQTFNGFYQKHRIITDNVELSRARMLLVTCTRMVVGEGLRLLGLEPLERM